MFGYHLLSARPARGDRVGQMFLAILRITFAWGFIVIIFVPAPPWAGAVVGGCLVLPTVLRSMRLSAALLIEGCRLLRTGKMTGAMLYEGMQALWALSSQPILALMAVPGGLLEGLYRMAGGGKYRSATEWRIVNAVTDLFSWALLVYLDFRIGWHAWFFNAAMGSAFLCSIVQQKWRREAGLPTGLEEWQQYGLPVEVGGRTGRRMPAVKQTVRLTPLAWGLAEDYRLSFEELASIHGSGEDGRITDGDLLKYLVARGRVTAAEPSAEATRPTVANTPVTRERRADGGARRWLVAVGIWVVFVLTAIFVRSLNDAPSSSFFVNPVQAAVALAVWLLYVGALFYAVARFAVIQGRTWAEAFGLIIPILNLYLVGRLFWYWAGLAVEVKPEVAQVTAHHALTPEEAHRRFAEDAAKAVRAAEEGSDG